MTDPVVPVVVIGVTAAAWIASDRYSSTANTYTAATSTISGAFLWIAGAGLVAGGYTYLGAVVVMTGAIRTRIRGRQVRESEEAKELWRKINE